MADKAADNGKNEEEKAQLKHQIQKLKQRLALVENIPIGNALSSSNMPVKSSPKGKPDKLSESSRLETYFIHSIIIDSP